MDSDEVVDSTECRRDACLDVHSVLWGVREDREMLFENSKYGFYDVARTGMLKVEQFFFVDRSSLRCEIKAGAETLSLT
jgi:hypothetical protein